MRFACAIGLGLAFLFADGMARAQQTPSPAKVVPSIAVVNKTTCDKSVAKVATPAPAVIKGDLFAVMDVNKDGKLCASEYKGPKKAFAWIDTDHDGSITRPEATRAYLTIVGSMAIAHRIREFQAMDVNKDGKVSEAEYKGPKRVFARVDANHDGVICPEEAKLAFQRSVTRFVIASRFRALDANHDGAISATEFKGPQTAFARFDTDKNGLINRAEFFKRIHDRAAAALQVATAKPAITPSAPAKPVAVVTKTDVVKTVKATSPAKPVISTPNVNGLNRILAMDANKDGKIGMGEYFKAVEARFVLLDQDKDGFITASDLAKVAALRNSKAIPAPVVATPAKAPGVKPATLKPAKPAAAQPAVKPGTSNKPVAAADAPHGPRLGLDVLFDQIDVNHDGVLTRAEIRAYVAKQARN